MIQHDEVALEIQRPRQQHRAVVHGFNGSSGGDAEIEAPVSAADLAVENALGAEDVGVDVVGDGPPTIGNRVAPAPRRESRGAVKSDPAHQLGRDIVGRLAARLPDPVVGFAPDRGGPLGLRIDHRPEALGVVPVLLGVHVK